MPLFAEIWYRVEAAAVRAKACWEAPSSVMQGADYDQSLTPPVLVSTAHAPEGIFLDNSVLARMDFGLKGGIGTYFPEPLRRYAGARNTLIRKFRQAKGVRRNFRNGVWSDTNGGFLVELLDEIRAKILWKPCDLLVDPIDGKTSLISLVRIRRELEALLGVRTDVLTPMALHERFRQDMLREAVSVDPETSQSA